MADRDRIKRGTKHSVEGKADKLKGQVKEAVGGLTNDQRMQAEGKWDKLKGSAKDKFGKVERKLGLDDDKEIDQDLERDLDEDRIDKDI
jgi:uncharacterized protein YjbJ (UPF0337 family)